MRPRVRDKAHLVKSLHSNKTIHLHSHSGNIKPIAVMRLDQQRIPEGDIGAAGRTATYMNDCFIRGKVIFMGSSRGKSCKLQARPNSSIATIYSQGFIPDFVRFGIIIYIYEKGGLNIFSLDDRQT